MLVKLHDHHLYFYLRTTVSYYRGHQITKLPRNLLVFVFCAPILYHLIIYIALCDLTVNILIMFKIVILDNIVFMLGTF